MKPVDMLSAFAPTRVEHEMEKGHWRIEVTPPAMFNLPSQSVVLTPRQYERYKLWRDGTFMIQDALPELNPDEREVLMTGLGDEDFQRFTRDPDEN